MGSGPSVSKKTEYNGIKVEACTLIPITELQLLGLALSGVLQLCAATFVMTVYREFFGGSISQEVSRGFIHR